MCYILLQLRLYSVAVPDTDIASHISLVTLQRPIWKDYGVLHFKMEDTSGATTLTNYGSHNGTISRSGGNFVTVCTRNLKRISKFYCRLQ